jgi:UDP-GlcNAc:undecaprenyl-phosphate/decaprenyl-phosphate GlcNAc-1-phosphate transferase
MVFISLFVISLLVSLCCTYGIRRYAQRFDITDKPGLARKIHTHPMPLLGGIAIGCSFLLVLWLYWLFTPSFWPQSTDAHVPIKNLFGISVGILILMIGGYLDDRYNLKPYLQVIGPLCAIFALIASGIGITILSNPFGTPLILNAWNIEIFRLSGVPYYFTVWADILTIGWIFISIYTTKFLDGLDGLVTGITVIGATIIGIFSLFFFVNVPTALLSIMTAGVFAGFLILNFHPARIFLGEAGSTIAGFLLGVLAIITGAKFAIALLILGIPILDAGWVITRRIFIEKRSPFIGDRKHLHFRLVDSGFTQRQAVGILYFFAVCFGGMALFLQSTQKLFALVILAIVMILVGGLLVWRHNKLSNAPHRLT